MTVVIATAKLIVCNRRQSNKVLASTANQIAAMPGFRRLTIRRKTLTVRICVKKWGHDIASTSYIVSW